MPEDVMTVWASGDNSSRLTLRQPIGLSLPNNQQLVLLLKAQSCRLTGKCLVTSIVHCTTHRGHTRTELCYLSTPQVWRQDVTDDRRRGQFKEIRDRFFALLNWVHFYAFHPACPQMLLFQSSPVTSASACDSQSPKDERKSGNQVLLSYFGIKYFETHVGKITFFKELATGRSPNPDSGTPDEAQDPSINILVKKLRRRMDKMREIPRQRMRGIKHEIGAMSKTLGIKACIATNTDIIESYHALCPLKGNLDTGCREYGMSKPITEFIGSFSPRTSASRHVEIPDMVEEIKKLQTVLDATKNIDEQLALEEDITGRAIPRLLPDLNQVLNSVLKEDKMYNLMNRVKFLEEISKVFNDALAELPTDDQAHLRRIMSDAEAGTSKHQLFLAEQTREQRALGTTHDGQTTV
ncbi:hypothetical protein EDC04DRAFT_2891194 [Pisolithus marmoratus]|nr:hypothetical protein EDC04DRAFT_2891194 [Pisolithus marmoratus]